MARSSSIINVSIIGDAKKLIGAVGQADAATGGLVKSAAKVLVAGKVVGKTFDLINDSLAEADRRGDAIQRLTNQIGDLSAPLIETADNFSKIGASAQDMLELEAIFADIATSAGVSEPAIAANAEELSAMALALAQVHDADPTTILEAIGKAIGGQTRGLKEYGIDLTEAAVQARALADTGKTLPKTLTATELAAARTALIMEQLSPLLGQVTDGTGDLAQKQDELGAKFETVMGKIGAGVEGPLTDVLQFINDEIDAIPHAIAGWQMLGHQIDVFGREALGPLSAVAQQLENILDLFGLVNHAPRTGQTLSKSSDRSVSKSVQREQERNGLSTGMGVP